MTPTEKATLLALAENPWITKNQIKEKTGHSRRTIYEACKRLKAKGLVKSKPSLKDARQTFWAVA